MAGLLLGAVHMPRKPVPCSATDPYHISARSINREWFDLPLGIVWSIMEDQLFLASGHFSLHIHSFVLMPNHFHLLATSPHGNISSAMQYFMRETSREMTRLSGRINQTYGNRHHKSLITSHHYFINAYKYIYRNPVRAGLSQRVEDYPHSTLSGLCGKQHLQIPVIEDTLLFSPKFNERTLQWLNTPSDPNAEDEMRRGLKRPIFKLTTSRETGQKSILEDALL